MKLKNKLLGIGALGLAGLVGSVPAQAHETIKHPGCYKVILGEDMSAWKAVEYVLFGSNKPRSTKEQRRVNEALIDSFNHTLNRHQLHPYRKGEIDKHPKESEGYKLHWDYIQKLVPDEIEVGRIQDYNWTERDTAHKGTDGLPMDKLREGDFFYMPPRFIANGELARVLDEKDGCRDHVIIADGTRVRVPKPKSKEPKLTQIPTATCPKCPDTKIRVDIRPIYIYEEKAPEVIVIPETTIPETNKADASKASLRATGGYLTEKLEGEDFMSGPKFDLDFDFTTGISENWNLTIDNDNHLILGSFENGGSTVIDSEASVSFDYKVSDSLRLGIGPRVSLLNASIDYDGNKAELSDYTAGAEVNAKLRTKHFDATLDYSFNKGSGGDSAQGHNPITQHKVDVEGTVHINPVHINVGYEYEGDKQRVRGIKRDNSDHTLEASVDVDVTDNVSLTAGYETRIHNGMINNTTSSTYKAGARFNW